ncbi:hypothetical protein FRC09_003881 [Ceratobasidium sp. 395]|nr:hypothetical protein FRC09_003881 [Ceratobasidium sp. 395]
MSSGQTAARGTRRNLRDLLLRTYDLGFTAFGGPPVHFQILHQRFVEAKGDTPWIDDQTYHELFSISQALPGPASTKMLFSIAFLHTGYLGALLVLVLWTLPGAAGMYLLSLGISKVDPVLPGPVYALLSGLNASTVGLITLAAVQLARKAITDPLTRLIVLMSACAGLCYNALWVENTGTAPSGDSQDRVTSVSAPSSSSYHQIPLKLGVAIILGFFAIFATLMTIRGTMRSSPLPLQLFTSMFLAGTIIFGGGPVVIPLLREYVVQPGWVSPRDFLIGLAIIQSFPGPNFNFAVYLGALTLHSTNIPTIAGAILGFVGIFLPGLTLALGFQSLWRLVRSNRFMISMLRGVNAAAVGLVFTAVHRLWEIGYVKQDAAQGVPLGSEPWWVVVAASAYVGVESFDVPTPLSIVGGGVLGLVWYAVVNK